MRANASDFIQDDAYREGPINPVFFCRQLAGTDGVQEVATFQMDRKVRDWATIIEDTELLADSVPGERSPRTPNTIISAYQCCTTVLERQSLRDPSTKPRSEQYQVLSSPNWFPTYKKLG